MIKYSELSKGDTLKVTGRQYKSSVGKERELAMPVGSLVSVVATLPEGVRVKTESGEEHVFAFEHGAKKLACTPETIEAIKKRESFGKKADAPKPAEDTGK